MGDVNYFCCLPGQKGVLPARNAPGIGLCVPSGESISASQSATLVRSIPIRLPCPSPLALTIGSTGISGWSFYAGCKRLGDWYPVVWPSTDHSRNNPRRNCYLHTEFYLKLGGPHLRLYRIGKFYTIRESTNSCFWLYRVATTQYFRLSLLELNSFA
jgi:hypothetical protein